MTQPIIAVVFNAPPRAGKDTLARLLPKYLSGSVRTDCFKRALFEATEKRILPEFSEALPKAFWGSDVYDEVKDDTDFMLMLTNGYEGTVRDCLIHVSEELCKPRFGNDYFGKQLAKDLKPGYNLITDGGFEEELQPVIDAADYTVIVQLRRNGFNFNNDSRDYIYMDGAMRCSVVIADDETPYQTRIKLVQYFIQWEHKYIPQVRKAIPAPYLETFS